uniref:Patched family protein n=1 Tax=Romanomermis culicivorax TaxID=13658 RepID=A0A915IF61_ROMCU
MTGFQLEGKFGAITRMGPDNVDFWLNNFNRMLYYDKGSIASTDFYGDLEFFLSIEEHAQYRNDIHWENDTQIRLITAFRAMISLKNISTSVDQMATADELRSLTSKYPEYNISTFHVLWRYVDQYQAVLPNTIQEVCSGVTFMILVALLLIPSATCSLWVILAILSIDAGIVGFMTFWGINLDTISMMTIVMNIGFSVDFTAHIAHSYVVVQAKDNDRMTKYIPTDIIPARNLDVLYIIQITVLGVAITFEWLKVGRGTSPTLGGLHMDAA